VAPIDTASFKVIDRQRPSEAELENYQRFRQTDSGVSPISHPGLKGGNYLASGIEHNERGAPTASGEIHARMNEKRLRKLNPLKRRRDLFLIEGESNAPFCLISWGSVAGVAIEAMQLAQKEGIRVKLIVPKLLYPVAEEIYEEFFVSVKRGLVVEQSHQGQLFRVLQMYVNVPAGVESLARSGSNPILVSSILVRLRKMSLALQRGRVPEAEPTLG
jgi:2-oxoglutarate/2-oxoacid ferredoxin oxidoreductase subunit alpha